MSYTSTEIGVPEFTFDFEQNTATATRKFRVTPWSAMDEAIAALAGGSTSFGSLMNITQPLKYPGKTYLWLLGVDAKPFHDCIEADSGGIAGDPAGIEMTLHYRSPRFETGDKKGIIVGEGYLTFERNMSLEFASEDTQGLYYDARYSGGNPYQVSPHTSTTINGERFYYGGGTVPIDSKIGAVIAVGDIRVTWNRVSAPPWHAINALQGMVNDRPFLDYAPEQVLFVGVNERRQFNVDGTDVWSLTYQFNVRIPKFKHTDIQSVDWDLNKIVGVAADNTVIFAYYEKWLPEQVIAGGWNHFPRKGTFGQSDSPYWQKVYRNKGDVDVPQTPEDLVYIPANFDGLFQSDSDSAL